MRINTAVIFGGKSVEHEISIISACQAMAAFDTDKYNIIPVYITKSGEFYSGAALLRLAEYKNIPELLTKCARCDFWLDKGRTYLRFSDKSWFHRHDDLLIDLAFPVVHGTNVEDGALQGFLRTANLPFFGCDVLASSVCMDKYVSKVLLQEAGVPVLPCIRAVAGEEAEQIAQSAQERFGFPVIVKPANLGSSVGISKAADFDSAVIAIDEAFQFASVIIIEPAVVNLREINCSVLGDEESADASECEEPIANDKILSYKDKYMGGGSAEPAKGGVKSAGAKSGGDKSGGSAGMASLSRIIPAEIPPELREVIRETAVRAFSVLGCSGIVRIDFLLDSVTNEFWLNEINTIPGSLSFYLWQPLGVNYTEMLDRAAEIALRRFHRQGKLQFSFDTNILAGFGSSSIGAKGAKR
ncbi:MAG: D-alanine--D-alanine ligase [Oscillospiraceae bacterium]|jgi:D-alanine-D-alanine ligase|nr:D-alanine--D-alanine ligase [Oscillospiraceae bacterium]